MVLLGGSCWNDVSYWLMRLRTIAAGFMLLLWTAAPMLSAVALERGTTPEERACCRKMAAKCGAMETDPHSCCVKVRPAPEATALATNSDQSIHIDCSAGPISNHLPQQTT